MIQQISKIINFIAQIGSRTNEFTFSLIKKLPEFVIWFLWDFSGIRYIWQKIRPPFNKSTGKRQPATFLLWTISIYLVLFGVISQRYENRVNVIQNRANIIMSQLAAPVGTGLFKNALSEIPNVQGMPCPPEPNILKPLSVLDSLFNNSIHKETNTLLMDEILKSADHLDENSFVNADFRYISLINANFQGTSLLNDKFTIADLAQVNFKKAELTQDDFRKAFLLNADFRNATFMLTDFRGAYLVGADFRGAYLVGADFRGACSGENADFRVADFRVADFRGPQYSSEEAYPAAGYIEETDLKKPSVHAYYGYDDRDANFEDAYLVGADFRYANITIEQLSKARSLYNTKLDPELMTQIEKDYPQLLKEPSSEIRKQTEKDYPEI